jgi:hypothetical protein
MRRGARLIALCIPEISMRIGSVAVVSAAAVIFVMAVLALPFLEYAFGPRMIVFLIPQGFSIALEVALMFGTLAALQGRRVTRHAVSAVLVAAGIASLFSFVNAGWITPAANQSFRVMYVEHAGGPAPQRSYPELTLNEIQKQYARATAHPGAVDARDLHYLAVSYHGRWAVTAGPIVFALFALALLRIGPIARWVMAAAFTIAYLSYGLYLTVPRLPVMDGRWLGGAAWYPEIALAALTVTLLFTNRREVRVVTAG